MKTLFRVLFKIIALPFGITLTILSPALTFLFCWAKTILEIGSFIGVLLSIGILIAGSTQGFIVFLILSFLISPFGIPAIAEWLINKVDDLSYSVWGFITR